MKFDNIDVSILYHLLQTPNLTTVDIAKKLFDKETKNPRQNSDSLIRHRLKMLVGEHIVICCPTIPKTYNANPEFVFLGAGSLHIQVNGGKAIEVNFGDFLVITDSMKYLNINRIGGESKDLEIIT